VRSANSESYLAPFSLPPIFLSSLLSMVKSTPGFTISRAFSSALVVILSLFSRRDCNPHVFLWDLGLPLLVWLCIINKGFHRVCRAQLWPQGGKNYLIMPWTKERNRIEFTLQDQLTSEHVRSHNIFFIQYYREDHCSSSKLPPVTVLQPLLRTTVGNRYQQRFLI
jgi:hypothetical protein